MNRAKWALSVLAAAIAVSFAGTSVWAESTEPAGQIQFNIIQNSGFEKTDELPVSARTFGKWYVGGAGCTIDDETAAEGTHSLLLSDWTEDSEVGYRVDHLATSAWAFGTEYECAGSFYAPAGGTAELSVEFTLWSQQTSHYVGGSLSVQGASGADWNELSLRFALIQEDDGFYAESGGKKQFLGRAAQISAIDIFCSVKDTDSFRLDRFRLRPLVASGDEGIVPPTGHAGADSFQGKGALANAGFEETDFSSVSTSDTAWFPVGSFVSLESQTDFVHAGERALKISGRVGAGDGASIRMNMAERFRDGKVYHFSGAFASLRPTVGVFAVRVYGYNAANADYPSVTATIASGALSQEWRTLTGTLKVSYEPLSRSIAVTTDVGTLRLADVDNVSALEFFICTETGAENAETALYADDLYLSLIRVPITPEDYDPEREGGSAVSGTEINHTTWIRRFVDNSGVALWVTGIGILAAIVAGIVLSITVKRHRKWNDALDRKMEEETARRNRGR